MDARAAVRRRAARDTLNAVIATVPPFDRAAGRLAGVAVALKDNIDVAGIETTNASMARAPLPATADATVVRRLRAHGADVFCKANMHELGAASISPGFGATRNPRDGERSSGGSSSGCAALVGAGVCDYAVGTDVGGSVRIPAAFCGVVGFKPSSGRIPLDGVHPTCPTCDHVGTITRTVPQAIALVGVLTGNPVPFESRLPMRVGVLRTQLDDPLLDAEVRAAVVDALERMRRAGVDLVELEDDLDEPARRSLDAIALKEARALHGWRGRDGYGLGMQSLLRTAASVDDAAYRDALAQRRVLEPHVASLFVEVDLIAGPTVATPAMEQEPQFGERGSGVDGRFTTLQGLLGLPALTVPCRRLTSGLPTGLQLAGRAGSDAAVLRAGVAVEALLSRS